MTRLEPLEPSTPAEAGYRRIRRQARPGLAALLALGVMVTFASTLWIAYQIGSRPSASGDVPVIHADTRPTKIRPEEPGGMQIPNKDKLVFSGDSPVERLLPPPETPLPRPAPASDTTAQATPAGPSQPASGPVAPALSPLAPAVSAPAPSVSTAPAPAPATTPAPGIPSQTARLPAPPSGGLTKGYRLQLGSVRSQEGARQEWERLKRANADLLGSLGFSAERADLGGRGIFYRIQAGPIAEAASAERLCNELKQRKVGCLLVKQ